MQIPWDRCEEIRKRTTQLKVEITERWKVAEDPDAFLRSILLHAAERYPRCREEAEQIAAAMASFFEEHSNLWEASSQNPASDPPSSFKSWKDKLENILDVLRKFVP